MSRWFFAAVPLVVVMGCGARPPMAPAPPPLGDGSQSLPLIDLSAMTSPDYDGPIQAGSFDSQVKLRQGRYVVDAIADCGTKLVAACTAWADKHRLPVVKSEQSQRRVLMDFYAKDHRGYFEVLYRVDDEARAARASFLFRNYDGTAVVPEVGTFESYGIDQLAENLRGVLTCSQN